MLRREYLPREYREYAGLLRRIGITPVWKEIQGHINLANPQVARYYAYFSQVWNDEQRRS